MSVRIKGMTTQPQNFSDAIAQLTPKLAGTITVAELDRTIYSTDASVYQQRPAAVAFPKDDRDIRLLIELANETGVALIPRTAGTSLSGQAVGDGIVVDVSRHFTEILEINSQERWVRVQPGVIRDELNMALAEHGLMFGPETSTSNRAMIGGMLGNNSCGSNSIVYGTTRDQTIEVTGFLSDGTQTTFGPSGEPENSSEFSQKVASETISLLQDSETQQRVRDQFPHPDVSRRNTGYAVDRLIEPESFGGTLGPLNFCHLIAGSEGTLFFTTEVKLRCHPLPPPESGLLCAHFESVDQATRAAQIIMRHHHAAHAGGPNDGQYSSPIFACELIDHFILEGAARNIEQQKNLDFVEGSPAAIVIVDLRGNERESIQEKAATLVADLKASQLGYAFPLLFDDAVTAIWQVRKSGLGVVANVVGDTKPVTLVEDTAVRVDVLPEYIAEVNELLLGKYNAQCVHYGHVGAGEIHLRPMVNLKSKEGLRTFRQIATDVAAIVKKHRGSLSGEHGDGRLRGEFLESMIGAENYQLLRSIKKIWDPNGIFNPGKIVDAPPMDTSLRYSQTPTREVATVMDFSETGGLQRAAEMCSGSGDCRKTELTGGVMCPSYMATRNEKDTTRARANVLRQVLTGASDSVVPLNDSRLTEVMKLCLACKGCKSECPSNVDVAKMKAEIQHANHVANGVPTHARRIAGFASRMKLASKIPRLTNWLMSNSATSGLLKRHLGFHSDRDLPQLHPQTLRSWFAKHTPSPSSGSRGDVILFCDEFTNFLDVPAGIATVEVLEKLGYRVEIPDHDESGRASISKGLLTDAKRIAERNVRVLADAIGNGNKKIVGIEPSALLTLRDEYLVLVDSPLAGQARLVADRAMLVDEFVAELLAADGIDRKQFTQDSRSIRLHGHCHQKALSSLKSTINMLQLPENYRVRIINSGCCGMAGSFGYERENYQLSMEIGELVLFPALRKEPAESFIAAGGTSCRQQILDGTGRIALHPVEILRAAMV